LLKVKVRIFPCKNKEIPVAPEPAFLRAAADAEEASASRWWWVFVVAGSLAGWGAIIVLAGMAMGFSP
jgi:hypothetical protein